MKKRDGPSEYELIEGATVHDYDDLQQSQALQSPKLINFFRTFLAVINSSHPGPQTLDPFAKTLSL